MKPLRLTVRHSTSLLLTVACCGLLLATGEAADWLHDYLDEESRATVREAIIEKGLKPALREYEERIRWTVYEFNWSQVCNGGISIGALAIADEEPAMAERVLSRALVARQKTAKPLVDVDCRRRCRPRLDDPFDDAVAETLVASGTS